MGRHAGRALVGICLRPAGGVAGDPERCRRDRRLGCVCVGAAWSARGGSTRAQQLRTGASLSGAEFGLEFPLWHGNAEDAAADESYDLGAHSQAIRRGATLWCEAARPPRPAASSSSSSLHDPDAPAGEMLRRPPPPIRLGQLLSSAREMIALSVLRVRESHRGFSLGLDDGLSVLQPTRGSRAESPSSSPRVGEPRSASRSRTRSAGATQSSPRAEDRSSRRNRQAIRIGACRSKDA